MVVWEEPQLLQGILHLIKNVKTLSENEAIFIWRDLKPLVSLRQTRNFFLEIKAVSADILYYLFASLSWRFWFL